MIASIIRWSVGNRFFVLLATFLLVGIGLYSVNKTPIDALPDLSDVQVIIKTSYPGQAPQVVEDQRYLSDDYCNAVSSWRCDCSRLFFFW